MIFISHNHKDKAVVEQIALKLAPIYRQENVFYDSWSIQPGEGIIDKMEKGLSNCKFFFFFVSENSLRSKMVSLEWQNALIQSTQNKIKLIPIRLDNCIMPALLTQTLYIDLYTYGLDVAIRQIVDVIDGSSTYRQPQNQFSNLVAYKYWDGDKLVVECHAKHYLEPISYFMYCTQMDVKNINADVKNETMYETDEEMNVKLANGVLTNGIFRSIDKGTLPQFPFVVEFSSKDKTLFDIDVVLHKVSHNKYNPIPILNKKPY